MPRKASHKSDRLLIERFDQIINIGPAMSEDFLRMGFNSPQELIGADPLQLYQRVCNVDQKFHDPCVLDVFMATVDYMDGKQPRKWWDFTTDRKKRYQSEVDQLRATFDR